MQDFALGDVLSITTGKLVSRDHIDGVYRVLNYMTGDNLMTHQLPRASRECEPILAAQYPELTGIEVPDFDGATNDDRQAAVSAWLDEMEAKYGSTLPVAPLPPNDHTPIDPLEELGLMGVPKSRVVPLVVPEGEGR